MHFVDAKGILTGNGGQYGMNIYRGCSHGCIYCDSRSRCYQFTHMFEDIEVKQNAPELLDRALKSKRKKCMIGTGAMSDPYIHCEEKLKLTRKCLEIILKNGFGVAIQTKSDRILRDIDLLDEINRSSKCVVQMTLTTYDDELCKILEPNVCNTRRRIEVLEKMQKRGISTIVWLTLREGSREYYYAALDKYFPGMKERYIERYGNMYELQSPKAKELTGIFKRFCKAHGILSSPEECFRYMTELPEKYPQLSLFEL